MNYDIFNSEDEKSNAQKYLPELEEHPGWKIIVKALDANILFLTDSLKDKKDFANLEQVYAMQERIGDFQMLKGLPQTIVAATIPQELDPEETDIYDTFPTDK